VIGYVALEDLLSTPEEKWGLRIEQTMIRVPLLVRKDESLGGLILKMIERGADHAFVVDNYENGRLLGVVATADVLKRLVGAAPPLAKGMVPENEGGQIEASSDSSCGIMTKRMTKNDDENEIGRE
ncbi:MAG: CBS domain-containing protein, partial [Candidatus Methanomethylicia archaeon]|nr:CBS domain-containing protein [Candidatus Methanomethylicia archaeon]